MPEMPEMEVDNEDRNSVSKRQSKDEEKAAKEISDKIQTTQRKTTMIALGQHKTLYECAKLTEAIYNLM
uniref:Uncharacterized protein n=1 Tax=Romanomermis culicivorax TaxID=13658 RepID=A0A915JIQ6_ROMCU